MISQRQRYITPGAVKFLDRRIKNGQFLLVPTKAVRNGFFYWLAYYARKNGLVLHRVVLMSNHHHLLFTDVLGVLPCFLRDFHNRIAHMTHILCGHSGPAWDAESRTCVMEVASAEAFVKCSRYVDTNPISAGITMHSKDWPGLISAPGESFTVPAYAKKADPSLPDVLTLPFAGATLDGYCSAELEEMVEDGLQEEMESCHFAYRNKGKKYLGVKRALRTARRRRPNDERKPSQHSPKWVAVTREAIEYVKEMLEAFWEAYRIAYQEYRDGNAKVEFPYGTWKMVHEHGCPCAPS